MKKVRGEKRNLVKALLPNCLFSAYSHALQYVAQLLVGQYFEPAQGTDLPAV